VFAKVCINISGLKQTSHTAIVHKIVMQSKQGRRTQMNVGLRPIRI